jgi:recombinational DNA repair ATPase RecF
MSWSAACAIEDLQLPGLTKQLKTRLQAAGIVTAADIDQHAAAMIEIAPDQVAALTDWRTYLDTQARVAAPNTLQPAEANVVRSAYARRRQHLEGEVQRWRTRVQAEAATFHNLSRTQQEALNKKIADAQARRSQEEEQIRKRFTQRYVQLGTDVSRVMQRISPQVQVATARLDEAQRKLAASQFDREQLVARMQDEYRAINFWTYVRWIFLGRNGLG